METATFLDLLTKEVNINPSLQSYYKLRTGRNRLSYRRAYLEQRLQYIQRHIGSSPVSVWDAGCGYGTTGIFLALNGHRVYGSTLEYYYEAIPGRLQYWAQYGDLSSLRIEYRNLYDEQQDPCSFDAIIAQDTLHHLEPVAGALSVFNAALKADGKLIVTEENGSNLFISLKNIRKRGFNRIIEYTDPRLGKKIMLANEHARSLQRWRKILSKGGFVMVDKDTEYIRLLPPFLFGAGYAAPCMQWERKVSRHSGMFRDLFFFGINYTAVRDMQELRDVSGRIKSG